MGLKERMDVVVCVREYEKDGETKKVWANVGSVVLFDDGGGVLELDAVPAPEQNRQGRLKYIAKLFSKRDNRGGGGGRSSGGGGGGPSGSFGDDDIPFAPHWEP